MVTVSRCPPSWEYSKRDWIIRSNARVATSCTTMRGELAFPWRGKEEVEKVEEVEEEEEVVVIEEEEEEEEGVTERTATPDG